MPRVPKDITLLLAILDSAYDKRSWHGPNLRGSLRGVTPAQGLWRPAAGRHNIWELMLHAAYWKYVAVRKLTKAKRGSFELEGSNFFERRAGTSADWRADLAVLERAHASLRETAMSLRPVDLTKPAQTEFTVLGLISGVAAHDLYHAGQIQLLKRLQPIATGFTRSTRRQPRGRRRRTPLPGPA